MFRFEDGRFASPNQLSPKARELYEDSKETMGEAHAKMWLEYHDYYVMDDDMNAVEVPFVEWGVYKHDNRAEVQIRIDIIGKWVISTVFLGVDHGFNWDQRPGYKPVLWETMIFYEAPRMWKKQGRYPDRQMWRYTSTPDAVAGHERVVKLVKTLRHLPRKLKKALSGKPGGPRMHRRVERFHRKGVSQ